MKDTFLERHKLLKLAQEKEENQNSFTSIIEIELVTKKFPRKKLFQAQMASLVNSVQHKKEKQY